MINYLIWSLIALLYLPVFYQLYHLRWKTIDYTHAYFILPLSLWFAWRKRAILKELIQKGISKNTVFSLGLLSLGILMFIFGWRQDYLFISTLSLIPVLFGSVNYLLSVFRQDCILLRGK